MRQTKKTYLVVTAMGSLESGLCQELTELATTLGCQIEQGHMALLGEQHTAALLLSGNWGAIAKFETALPNFQQKQGIKLQYQRTEVNKPEEPVLHYFVQAIAADNHEHTKNIINFFTELEITIIDLYSQSYIAQNTGTAMWTLNLTVEVPADDSISELRDQFMIFCDEQNIDALLEAERQ